MIELRGPLAVVSGRGLKSRPLRSDEAGAVERWTEMGRTFLMIRSVAFAFVTKISGGATVFLALPLISHGASPVDYATFLTTMNIAASIGLIFVPFAALYIRELAHAFATEDPQLLKSAVRNTFGSHATLMAAVIVALAAGLAATSSLFSLNSSVIVGLALSTLQLGASWGQIYRIAHRSDYVTSIVQTAGNVVMVLSLVMLSRTDRLSGFSAATVYFGVPAFTDVFILAQLLATRQVDLRIGRSAIRAFWTRVPESAPLYLSPVADYLKVYASAMLVLAVGRRYDYIVFSTSILLVARLVNPVTLITRPLMPAYIDAIHRDDAHWLNGLRKAFFGAALVGAIVAAIVPLFMSESILAFIFPKEVHDLSLLFIVFCSYFGFSYALVALLGPLYIGARRASFYGVWNFAFTLAGALLGTLLCIWFGAAAMMGSLAVSTTICGFFLLASIRWSKDQSALKSGK